MTGAVRSQADVYSNMSCRSRATGPYYYNNPYFSMSGLYIGVSIQKKKSSSWTLHIICVDVCGTVCADKQNKL